MPRWFTEFWRNSPYSKICILTVTIISIWIWWSLALIKLDLLFSVAVVSFVAYVLLLVFQPLWPELNVRSIRASFAVCSVSAYFFTAILSGYWSIADRMSFTCFGTFHFHHWLKYALGTAFLLRLTSQGGKVIVQRKQWICRSTIVSIMLFVVAFFSILDMKFFSGNRSLEIEFFILSLFYVVMSRLVGSREFSGRWFKLLLTISIAVHFGVFLNGLVGFIGESSEVGTIPNSLIFFNDSKCEP